MAKNKSTRRRRSTPQPRPRPDSAAADLAASIQAAIASLTRLSRVGQSDRLAQRFALEELVALAESVAVELDEHRQDLLAAVELDRNDVPLAGTYPTGDLWSGPQRPRYLIGLARRAGEDPQPVTYTHRLSDVDLAVALDPACPRQNADGGRCHGQRVRLAGRRRAEACWTHLSADRKAQIRADRDRAVAGHRCRSCAAAAGDPCRDAAGKATQPHTARLDVLG